MCSIPIDAVYDNAKVRIKFDTINRIFQFHSYFTNLCQNYYNPILENIRKFAP